MDELSAPCGRIEDTTGLTEKAVEMAGDLTPYVLSPLVRYTTKAEVIQPLVVDPLERLIPLAHAGAYYEFTLDARGCSCRHLLAT
jgi:hypothetical protein